MDELMEFKFEDAADYSLRDFSFDTGPVLNDLRDTERPRELQRAKGGKHQKFAEIEALAIENSLILPKRKKKATSTESTQNAVGIPLFKKGEEKLLQNMSAAILNKCFVIRHNDGLYAFNGRIYTAIKNDLELLELVRSEVSKDAFSATSTKPFQDLYNYFKADKMLVPYNYDKQIKAAKNLIAFDNGILDIETGELLDFSEKHLIFHMLNAKWKQKSPRAFLQFLEQASGGDEEIKQRILEFLGYIFSGCNDGKCFFVLGTAPNSGKSTLADFIISVLGEEFVSSISTHQLGGRFSLGDIQGKIANLAMDVPKGKLNPTVVSIIKNITGKDSITIEQKYQRPETIRSNMRFVFGTNYPVRLPQEDDEDSFWNRMVIVPFQHSVPEDEIDVELIDKLLNEKNAVVTLCIKAYQQVRNNNFRFSPCRAADDMKRSWRKSDITNYSFMAFWQDCIEVTGNMQDAIFSMDLYDAYNIYCLKRGFECIGYKDMRLWIQNHIDSDKCIAKRVHRTGDNPRAAYCGIKQIRV